MSFHRDLVMRRTLLPLFFCLLFALRSSRLTFSKIMKIAIAIPGIARLRSETGQGIVQNNTVLIIGRRESAQEAHAQ